jgi:predicted Zn-dependent peptidase
VLIKAYEAGHGGLRSDLKRTRDDDFQKSVYVPAELEIIISGDVSIERLFRHVKIHLEAHTKQINTPQKNYADAPE